jgi:uracil-DNA glycosylase
MPNFVKGDGPVPCDVMVIGEAPGATEDRLGKPFVGRSGATLNTALAAVGLPRENVYVTNLYKHRPPDNRPPTAEEIKEHIHYLIEEYHQVRPKYVLLLGNTVLHTLTDIREGISKGRGYIPHKNAAMVHSHVYATYHPSAVRSHDVRAKFEADLATFANIVRTRKTPPTHTN